MSDEQRNQLRSFMSDILQLDEQSFIQIQFATSVLLARERQISLSKEKSLMREIGIGEMESGSIIN